LEKKLHFQFFSLFLGSASKTWNWRFSNMFVCLVCNCCGYGAFSGTDSEGTIAKQIQNITDHSFCTHLGLANKKKCWNHASECGKQYQTMSACTMPPFRLIVLDAREDELQNGSYPSESLSPALLRKQMTFAKWHWIAMSYTTCLSMGGDSILSTHRRPTPPTNYTAHTLPNWQIAEIAIFFWNSINSIIKLADCNYCKHFLKFDHFKRSNSNLSNPPCQQPPNSPK
jgi:hypothetical protein